MAGPLPRPLESQEDFSFRLAQWLLDQLQSPESLGTVTSLFAALLSQAPQELREGLRTHIGQLVFKKLTQSTTIDPLIKLYTQLCYSLYLDSFSPSSTHTSTARMTTHIHEDVFHFCIDFLSLENQSGKAGAQGSSCGTTSPKASKSHIFKNVSLSQVSLLVSELYSAGLVSIADVHEYLQRLTESAGPIEARLTGFCVLFEARGPNFDVKPWNVGVEPLLQWARSSALKYSITDHIRSRIETIIRAHSLNLNQQTDLGAETSQLPHDDNSSTTGSQPVHLTKWQMLVKRQVETLLDMLLERDTQFDSILRQILDRANDSEKEMDASTLKQVVELILEKVMGDEAHSEVLGRLCKRMKEGVSPNIQDGRTKNSKGQLHKGQALFVHYLLTKCQQEFEGRWMQNAGKKASRSSAALNDREAKVGHQGPALVCFLGELFRQQLLKGSTMHTCIQTLILRVSHREEGPAAIESLCKLLGIIGQKFDTPENEGQMHIYFGLMEVAKKGCVDPKMQSMLQEIIELRARHWQANATRGITKSKP